MSFGGLRRSSPWNDLLSTARELAAFGGSLFERRRRLGGVFEQAD